MFDLKIIIIAAIAAFIAGTTVTAGAVRYYYVGKIEKIELAHALNIEKRITAGLNKTIELATSQNTTINRLEQEKSKVIGETNAQNKKLQNSFDNLRGSVLAGGLLRDNNPTPAKQTGAAGKDGTAAGTAGTDSNGILSRQTSENLLDYGRSAETTRLDLIRQKGSADTCVKAYNELVDKYNESTGAKP